jgi:16S rRNA processing protein RimM
MTSKLKKQNELLLVGKILRAHGIKGELKVLPLTNSPDEFATIKTIHINNKVYECENIRVANSHLIIKLDGFSTRNEAEKFADKEIYVDFDNRPAIKNDEYYIADLQGLEVTDGTKSYGFLENVIQTGSVDVYCVKGIHSLMFPALKSVIIDVDFNSSKILVSADELVKVAVYNDN